MSESATEVLLALDAGTGGTRVTAYALNGVAIATSSAEYPTFYDKPGWAEQDPEHWRASAISALCGVTAQLPPRHKVYAIGLTGQSPTVAPFDKAGHPLRRGLLYQDNRATVEAEEWHSRLAGRDAVHRRTGHDPAAFHIGPKVLWIRKHEPALFDRTQLWLQPRDYVAWTLTGQCATDWSHAGSTLLFDIHDHNWAGDMFSALEIPLTTFPQALPPWAVLGETGADIERSTGLPHGTPVVLGGADSQCCVIGAGVVRPSELSDMAGSSTCLNAPVKSPLRDLRIANYCHVLPGWWCTELGLNASGLSLEWMARLLASPGLGPSFKELEAKASESPPGCKGLLFLPYMADGERFDASLRGGFCALSLRHNRGDLARAVLEGVSFAIRRHLDIMAEAGAPIHKIRVSGGGARVDLWNQIKADVTGVPVESVMADATSLGVALVAGAAISVYSSLSDAVAACVRSSRSYEPDLRLAELYEEHYAHFRHLARATCAHYGT